jgi:hypothetical protein
MAGVYRKPSRFEENRKQLDHSTILARSPLISFETINDEAILIHIDSGDYYSLNRVGLEFWKMLDGRHTIAQHARTLAELYDQDPDEVAADLLVLATVLAEKDLVEQRP